MEHVGLRLTHTLSPGTVLLLVLVTFLWSLCFPLITVGLAAAPPLSFAGLRAGLAGAALLALAFALRRPVPTGLRAWLALVMVGMSATGLGLFGMFIGGGRVSPGIATVIENTQPLITAVLAPVVLGEGLDARCKRGLTLGFTGIVLISVPQVLAAGHSGSAVGIGYLLLGALGVAWGNVVLKCLAGKVDVLMASGWQLALGSLPLLIAARVFEGSQPIAWGPSFLLALFALSLLGTALASVLWFSLLRRADLSRLNAFTFLTPIFGLLMGIVLFEEPIDWIDGAGVGLALLGVRQVIRAESSARSHGFCVPAVEYGR